MTADLERRLRDAFHDDAASARLVNPDRPADPGSRPLAAAPPPTRTWRAIAAAAALAAVVAAGGAASHNPDPDPLVTTPPDPTTVTTAPEPAELFPDLRPDATVAIPLGPTRADGGVWTGTEVVTFGEPSAPNESPPPAGSA